MSFRYLFKTLKCLFASSAVRVPCNTPRDHFKSCGANTAVPRMLSAVIFTSAKDLHAPQNIYGNPMIGNVQNLTVSAGHRDCEPMRPRRNH
jgi:hypothetical protein